MALPQITKHLGRQVYRGLKGEFISLVKYELLTRKAPSTGKFRGKGSGERRLNTRAAENHLRSQLGRPPSGLNWVFIVDKYPDRFEAFTEGIEFL